jgi:hypothetical protein
VFGDHRACRRVCIQASISEATYRGHVRLPIRTRSTVNECGRPARRSIRCLRIQLRDTRSSTARSASDHRTGMPGRNSSDDNAPGRLFPVPASTFFPIEFLDICPRGFGRRVAIWPYLGEHNPKITSEHSANNLQFNKVNRQRCDLFGKLNQKVDYRFLDMRTCGGSHAKMGRCRAQEGKTGGLRD